MKNLASKIAPTQLTVTRAGSKPFASPVNVMSCLDVAKLAAKSDPTAHVTIETSDGIVWRS